MSARNKRAAKAARRKARAEHDSWEVTERPGYYSAVRDDGLGVSVRQVTPDMLAALESGEDVFDLMRAHCPHCQADGC